MEYNHIVNPISGKKVNLFVDNYCKIYKIIGSCFISSVNQLNYLIADTS